MTEVAAIMPECTLQNIAQPHRKPHPGDSVSFRNTYTPPVRGNADESSAQTSAPERLGIPATIQTKNMPGMVGTWRLISEGCTKIDAPIMMPTTMAVACNSPMGRWSRLSGTCVKARSVYHKRRVRTVRVYH